MSADLHDALSAIAARLDRIEGQLTASHALGARLSAIEERLAGLPDDRSVRDAFATVVDTADALAARTDADARLRTLARLAERLTDEDRIGRLERLDHLAAQVPGLVATAVDSLDGLAAQPGLDPDARLRAALRLVDRLTEPATAATLERALDLAGQVPGLVATAVDSLDGLAAQPGLDPDARLRALVRLLDLASQPGTAALVDQLSQHADTLPVLLRLATTTMDVAADTVLASRVPLAERVRTGFEILERATDPATARRLVHALDGLAVLDELLVSGALDPGAVRVVGHAATALRETAATEPTPVGPLGQIGRAHV